MKAFADAVRLRTLRFCSRMIDVLQLQIELIGVVFGATTIFGAPVGQDAQQANAMLFRPGNYPIAEQFGGRQRILTNIQLSLSDFTVGIRLR